MSQIILQTGWGLLQGLIMIAIAPIISGLVRVFKAAIQGRWRTLTNLWQPYRDLVKLMRKPAIRSLATSWVFAVTPILVFGIYGTLACMLPLFPQPPEPILPAQTDLILILYLLGAARFIVGLAGLDSCAPFGGLGSSREVFFHFLTEVGLGAVIAALMIKWDTFNLNNIVSNHKDAGISFFIQPDLLLLALALFLLILFEGERIPVDNPSTHLELTMAHRAILLDYAGRDLALLEWAEMTKLTFLLGLWGSLFVPLSLPGSGFVQVVGTGGLFLLKLVMLSLIMAVWEIFRPKLRLRAVGGLSMWAVGLSILAMIYTFAQSVLRSLGNG